MLILVAGLVFGFILALLAIGSGPMNQQYTLRIYVMP